MEKVMNLISKIAGVRNIPQFLLAESIKPQSLIKIRSEIFKYKKQNSKSAEVDLIINSPGGNRQRTNTY